MDGQTFANRFRVRSAQAPPAAVVQGFNSEQTLQPAHFLLRDGLESAADSSYGATSVPGIPEAEPGPCGADLDRARVFSGAVQRPERSDRPQLRQLAVFPQASQTRRAENSRFATHRFGLADPRPF